MIDIPFKKEDFAFGLEMSVTAILLLLGNSVIIAQATLVNPDLTASSSEKLLLDWLAYSDTYFWIMGHLNNCKKTWMGK